MPSAPPPAPKKGADGGDEALTGPKGPLEALLVCMLDGTTMSSSVVSKTSQPDESKLTLEV